MIKVDFGLLEIVNRLVNQNVVKKDIKIDMEVEEHIGATNLQAMAEFDGGHDLSMVEHHMTKSLRKKADIYVSLKTMKDETYFDCIEEVVDDAEAEYDELQGYKKKEEVKQILKELYGEDVFLNRYEPTGFLYFKENHDSPVQKTHINQLNVLKYKKDNPEQFEKEGIKNENL